jgi:hypothetical protein
LSTESLGQAMMTKPSDVAIINSFNFGDVACFYAFFPVQAVKVLPRHGELLLTLTVHTVDCDCKAGGVRTRLIECVHSANLAEKVSSRH